jgi:putative ABC transport system permease protein
MKFLPFIVKQLRRNWVRSLSTIMAMGTCIFLFCTLQSVLAELNAQLASASASRLVTRHAVSVIFSLPISYASRIESVPGVKRVARSSWFGGSLTFRKEGKADEGSGQATDFSSFFPNFAVDAEPYFTMSPEYHTPPVQWQAFLADRRGCLIGRALAEKFGWKPGDVIHLQSTIPTYRKSDGPFEFVVRGIYTTDSVEHPEAWPNGLFFHFDYLYEGVGRTIGAGTYAVEIAEPEKADEISRAVDALFENSDAQTHTETEAAFRAEFINMAGNLSLLLNGIGLAVSFTILLVTANTMSMSVRERRTEIAVLRTLGFSSGRVMALIVAEALLLGGLGGGLGVGSSQTLMWVLSRAPGLREALASIFVSGLTLRPFVACLGFAVALVLGFAAGIVPAWGACRSKITDMLRAV